MKDNYEKALIFPLFFWSAIVQLRIIQLQSSNSLFFNRDLEFNQRTTRVACALVACFLPAC
jgi:hypothetical protein